MQRFARSWLVGAVLAAAAACVIGCLVGAQEKLNSPVIGIGLGTTYSCVGVYKGGRVEIIPNDQGNRITPSYVAWTAEGDFLIGEAAKNQAIANPNNTIFDVKRLIGRKYSDKSVQAEKKLLPYHVVNKDDKPYIEVDIKGEKKTFSPEEISAMILGRLKQDAEAYLGKNVQHAVVTVPAYFNDAQRQATKDAASIAGLDVLRVIHEPMAAAIAYGLDRKRGEKNILVFDLGGGTFDVTLLVGEDGVFEVLATNGDTHLGGEDFDQRVMQYFITLIKKKHNVDISGDKKALQRLHREAERAKRALSSQHRARVEVDELYDGIDFSETLTRARFEELNLDLFKKTLGPVQKALEEAGMDKSEVDEIVLVGGSTRIPKVQQLLRDFFGGKEPNRGVNPDEVVANGAAIWGAVLASDDLLIDQTVTLCDFNALSVGVEAADGCMTKIIPRNSLIPTKKSRMFTTRHDNQSSVVIHVIEGERATAKHNHLLRKLQLTGIPPAPRGVPLIEVTVEIDTNHLLHVTAQDKATGKQERITADIDDVLYQSHLSAEEIDRMIREAEEFAEEDARVCDRQEHGIMLPEVGRRGTSHDEL